MLAASLGRKVVALDFDLEAPGLPYKLFEGDRPRAEGLVGWLRDTRGGKEPPASLDDYVVDVPLPGPALRPGGSLTLMPAGRAPSPNYFQDLRRLRLDQGLDEGWALDALVDLRDRLATELNADLLLIDARTGVTSTNRVSTHVLADDIVALALDTPEQLEGTRSVLRSLQPLTSLRTGEKLGLHLVLSRVVPRPSGESIYARTPAEKEQATRVLAFFTEPAQPVVNTVDVDHTHLLHHDPSLNRSEFLALARPGPWTRTALHVDYWRIATAVLGPEAEGAAVAALDAVRADPDRLEELAHYFVSTEVATEARAMRSRAGRIEDAGRPEMGLEEQVEILRRQASSDPTVLPDLAALVLDVASRLQKLGRRDEALEAVEDALAIYRRLLDTNPAAYEPDLARALTARSVLLGEIGQRDDALAAIQDAVAVYRRLDAGLLAAFEPALADSLNTLSSRLAELGRSEEGLVAVEEAVGLYRRLVAIDPAGYEPALADALTTLSNRLGEVGRSDDGLAANEEAVALYRRLAAAGLAADEPALARSLNSLSLRLGEVGRSEEGLAAIEEAVAVRRRLSTANPAAHEFALACSLNNLSLRLAERGRREEGLAAIEDAVVVFRRLAAANLAAYEWALVRSLDNLSRRNREVGRRKEGLAAIEDAVAGSRRLASTNPAAYDADLGRSLTTLSILLRELGRIEDGLAASVEAVAVFRSLMVSKPAAHEPDFAYSLGNLSMCLSAIGRGADGLAAMEEAISIYRRLAATKSGYELYLAWCLHTWSIDLGRADRLHDALAAIEDAVGIRRRLAATDPAAHEPDLARALTVRSIWLAAVGQGEEAKRAKAESEDLTRRLLRGGA